MSVLKIPVDSSQVFQRLKVQLDGVVYRLRVDWNQRASAYCLGLFTVEGDPISVGHKVVVGGPLIWRGADARRPPGIFAAVDTAGGDEDPQALGDLGARVVLLYYDRAELASQVARIAG